MQIDLCNKILAVAAALVTCALPLWAQSVISGTCPYCTLRDVVSVKDSPSSSQPGATGNGSSDDTAAIQRAISRCPSTGCTVFFPAGRYKITRTIVVSQSQVELVGQGRGATMLEYAPTTSGPAILVSAPLSCDAGTAPCEDISRNAIKNLEIYSADTTMDKVGIRLIAAANVEIQDVVIGGAGSGGAWTGGSPAIGLEIRGHEFASISGVMINADLPISIEKNPVTYPAGTFDISHFHFSDLYVIAGSYPCVELANPLVLLEVTFDGAQAWVGGTYGLYWNNSSETAASHGLSLQNVRTEQGRNSSAFTVWINSPSAQMQSLMISNMHADPGRGGLYLRHTYWANVTNFLYGGTHVALDADSSNSHLVIHSSYIQHGSTFGSSTSLRPASDGYMNTTP